MAWRGVAQPVIPDDNHTLVRASLLIMGLQPFFHRGVEDRAELLARSHRPGGPHSHSASAQREPRGVKFNGEQRLSFRRMELYRRLSALICKRRKMYGGKIRK